MTILNKSFILIFAFFSLAATPVLAAKPSVPAIGNDISYPQCGKSLPTGQSFGIVGVNNGVAGSTNPCLLTELSWAQKPAKPSPQPAAQLYVNTGNPGDVLA